MNITRSTCNNQQNMFYTIIRDRLPSWPLSHVHIYQDLGRNLSVPMGRTDPVFGINETVHEDSTKSSQDNDEGSLVAIAPWFAGDSCKSSLTRNDEQAFSSTRAECGIPSIIDQAAEVGQASLCAKTTFDCAVDNKAEGHCIVPRCSNLMRSCKTDSRYRT